jgi:hypothetical protein
LEADHQLDLSELLSCAWLIQSSASQQDAWRASILAQANHRARQITLGELSLHRLGPRAWGGIVLATALTIVLGLFDPGFNSAQNRSGTFAASGDAADLHRADTRPLLDLGAAAPIRPVVLADPDDPNASKLGQNTQPDSTPEKSGSSSAPDSPGKSQRGSVNPGAGSGSARTDPAARQSNAAVSERPEVAVAHDTAPRPGVDAASGTGASSGQSTPGDDLGISGVVGTIDKPEPPAPWHASTWPARMQGARDALAAGRVPTAYSDLVRGYFARE